MNVTVWGCRGSITSPGRDTLRYGGETTCLEIVTDGGDRIVIDAGSGLRRLGQHILKDPDVADITLLLTHAHWDHLVGFPFFRPAFFSKYTITLCGGSDPRISVLKSLRHQMEPPYFPVDMSVMKAKFVTGCTCGCSECGNELAVGSGSHRCESIPLSHPNGGYGFKLTDDRGRAFVLLTDNELRYRHETGLDREGYVEFCRDARLLFHDACYTEEEYERTRTWGHSTYKDAIDLAIDAGVERLGLFHHNPDRGDDEIDGILGWCRSYISGRGSGLDCFACAEGMTLAV